jgi:hypothetical protein
MKKIKYQLSMLCVCAFMVSCASHTGVVSIGKDTYMVAKQQATGFPGLGNLKAEIIVEGAAHCKSLNKEFQLISTTESQPPYIWGNYPRSEITFMCIDADDLDHRRPRLQRTPDSIIKIEAK